MLLEALKEVTEDAVKDLLLPVRRQEGDGEDPEPRRAEVYRMRLPDSKSYKKKAPYIILQVLTGKDVQREMQMPESTCEVRFVFCVYSENEQEGSLYLLNLMERVRERLLSQVLIGEGQFDLDLGAGVEGLIYDEDTAPYYAGEMMTAWRMPPVQRRIDFL